MRRCVIILVCGLLLTGCQPKARQSSPAAVTTATVETVVQTVAPEPLALETGGTYLRRVLKLTAKAQDAIPIVEEIGSSDPKLIKASVEAASDFGFYMIDVEDAYKEAKKLDPPSPYAPAHETWLAAMERYNAASGHFYKAVVKEKFSEADKGSQAIRSANDLMDEAGKVLPVKPLPEE